MEIILQLVQIRKQKIRIIINEKREEKIINYIKIERK